MATRNDVLRIALSQVGVVEGGGSDGRSGNITKYWAELEPDFQGESWCAAFVSWVFKHAGAPLPSIDHPWGYAACRDGVAFAKQRGIWNSKGNYQPGDIIFFCWDGSGVADHTGIVVSDNGRVVTTVEGNTSGTDSGSQRNGGGVYKRQRPHGPTILGVMSTAGMLKSGIAAPAKAAAAKAVAKVTPRVHNPYHMAGAVKVGSRGVGVQFVQWAVGQRTDGIFGPATQGSLKTWQQAHHLPVTGVADIKTLAALAAVTR